MGVKSTRGEWNWKKGGQKLERQTQFPAVYEAHVDIYTGARMLGVVPRGSPSSEIYPWLKTAFVSGILFQERGINFRIRGYWRQSTSKNAAGQNRLVDTTESKQNPVINVANQSIRKYQCLMRVNYFRARSGMTLKTNKNKTNKPRNKQK